MAQVKQKKSSSTLPLLVGAIGFGIAAALLSVLYLKTKEKEILESLKGPDVQQIEVVVATGNLTRGALVAPQNFAVRQIPATFVHADVVYPGEFERYLGRSLTSDLATGKPLLKGFLDESFPRDFSDTIPPGRRAITVTVDEVNSVAGLIRPGNQIDVFVTISYKLSGFAPEFISVGLYKELPPELSFPGLSMEKTQSLLNQIPDQQKAEVLNKLSPGDVMVPVLQNVQVLATDQLVAVDSLERFRAEQYGPDTNFSSVTLNVTPEQAALVTIAQSKGTLLAILRNRRDDSASGFDMLSAGSLFENAAKLAAESAEQASRATVVAGVDANGNLVDAQGKSVMSARQLAAAGLAVNENGQIVDGSGNVIDPRDVIISPDGTVMTRQQLAEAGITVNQSGQLIDKDGRIISAKDVVLAADGSVMTREQLAAAGLTINENGEIQDKNGKIVSADDLVVTSSGKVMSKQQLAAAGLTSASGVDTSGNLVDAGGKVLASREQLAAAGYTVNANGQVVDQNGNVVDPGSLVVDKSGNVLSGDDIQVAADGTVLTREQLAAAGLSTNANGELVDKDGNIVSPADVIVASDGSVMTSAQLAKAGLSINESGQVVDKNGNPVDSNDLITGPGGTVLSRKQLESAGLKVDDQGRIVDSKGNVMSAAAVAQVAQSIPITGAATGVFDMVIGGASKDGVAKTNKVPIVEGE